MQISRRRLPHQYPEGKWLFVTWHLHGSLSHARYPPQGPMNAGKAFVWMDRYLDTTRVLPLYLSQDPIAQIVADSLRRGVDLGHYDLHAWVIMANHVHVLLLPKVNPSELLRIVKGVTARDANRILGRTGQSFWQRESYDRWVRDQGEFDRIAAYIERNPVAAGLVQSADEYRWSSASAGKMPALHA